MVMIVALQECHGFNSFSNPKTLPADIGVDAANLDPLSGDIRSINGPSTVHTLTGYGATQQQALYRMGRNTASDTQYWLAFTNPVDFARSMLASDPLERTYGTGGNFTRPAFTDNTFLSAPPYPTGGFDLGVPAPATAMSAAVNVAGSGSQETRSYVSTFLRPAPNSDESAPSPAVKISVPSGSTVDLTSLAAVPGGAHGITRRKFYVATTGDYLECGEVLSGATTFTDTGTRGAILQTGGSVSKPAWMPPPDTMVGLIELWAGMHGAFDDKSYMTCQPYFPHAWPLEYRRKVPDKIVGTAKWGQNWFLATTGVPRVVLGSTPLGMSDSPINFKQACVSRASVKSVGHGVCWASNSGLCYHGQKGTYNITERLIPRSAWRAMVPSTIIGASWGSWYIGFYNDGTRKGFMVNVDEPRGVIRLDQEAFAVFEDSVSDALYLLVTGNVIKKWDYGSSGLGSVLVKSRVYRHPEPTCPGVARIIATTYPVTFSLWADGAAKVTNRSVLNDEPFTLPSGYLAEEFQVQVSGTGPIEGVYVAEEFSDLP